jgi:four helix bundle protein
MNAPNPNQLNAERRARNVETKPARSAVPSDLKQRTKRFALGIIMFFESLPKDETSRVLGRQLLRSGTSVGANYRSAKRAKSNADFINKMTIVEEEADECGYWLELLTESEKITSLKTEALHREANELVAIAIASINTARKNGRKS